MPLFNPMFAFLFSHSFQRLNNMYLYLGPGMDSHITASLNARFRFRIPKAYFQTSS